jgi:hypothetical protein
MVGAKQFICEPADGAKEDPRTYPPVPEIFSSAEIPFPSERPLRVYAFDPSAGRFVGNYMTVSVRYEPLPPGPMGDRFTVIDYDGSNKTFYTPVHGEFVNPRPNGSARAVL